MKINDCEVVSDSARKFPAIGGGYGVKINIVGGGELLFGPYPNEESAQAAMERLWSGDHASYNAIDSIRRVPREKRTELQLIRDRKIAEANEEYRRALSA